MNMKILVSKYQEKAHHTVYSVYGSWISSCGLDFKSNQKVDGYLHNSYVTIALTGMPRLMLAFLL